VSTITNAATDGRKTPTTRTFMVRGLRGELRR
jgi:hypothetical protein